MKKISKKQRLIIAVVSILLIILIAILVSTVVRNRTNVNEGNYETANGSAGSSSLLPEYIKEGITLGGVTGTLKDIDTSDATAKPEDITKGKTAYVDGVKITGTYEETVEPPPSGGDEDSTLETVTGNETTNTEVKDKYGNKVIIPAGFKVVNPEDDVTKGIIIEDVSAGNSNTKGSQFVWIPIGDIKTETGTKNIQLGRYTFSSSGTKQLKQSAENWSDTSSSVAIEGMYKELESSSYGNPTAKNLGEFVSKALSSGGYYIGRYEAGDAYATSTERTSDSGFANPIVCKANVYPYNYISQPEASVLCQYMYTRSAFVSDLVNSYAFDTAIVFLQEFGGDNDYSMQSSLNSTLLKCGASNDIKCNIYDLAGNTSEWSTESYTSSSNRGVSRGGNYNRSDFTTCKRYGTYTTSIKNSYVSTRPIIYL